MGDFDKNELELLMLGVRGVFNACPQLSRQLAGQLAIRSPVRLLSSPAILRAESDRFGGVTVALDDELVRSERLTTQRFADKLKVSVEAWKREQKQGVWLRIDAQNTALLPVAIDQGFEMHHAQRDYVMLAQWLPETPSLLPGYASHYIGAGAVTINSKGEILVMAERFGLDATRRLKLPGGMLSKGEGIGEGVEREVLEETGVRVRFVSLACFRHNLEYPGGFGSGDIYFVARCEPIDEDCTEVSMDPSEVSYCAWVPVDEFLADSDVYAFNKVIVEMANQEANFVGDQMAPRKLPSGGPSTKLTNYYKKGAVLYHGGQHRDVDNPSK